MEGEECNVKDEGAASSLLTSISFGEPEQSWKSVPGASTDDHFFAPEILAKEAVAEPEQSYPGAPTDDHFFAPDTLAKEAVAEPEQPYPGAPTFDHFLSPKNEKDEEVTMEFSSTTPAVRAASPVDESTTQPVHSTASQWDTAQSTSTADSARSDDAVNSADSKHSLDPPDFYAFLTRNPRVPYVDGSLQH